MTRALKYVVIVDCETTGPDPEEAEVVEVALVLGLDEGAPEWVWRVRPSHPIPPGASAVHGIRDEDVRDCPTFGQIAEELRAHLARAEVLVGYNVRFDLAVLGAEARRHDVRAFELDEVKIVDPYEIWRRAERRSLGGAHERFVGRPLEVAHAAASDAAAAGRVLNAMIAAFGLEEASWDDLAEMSQGASPHASRVGSRKHGPPIILFDGTCKLCSGWVRFVVRWDPKRRYRLAAIESRAGRRLLAQHASEVRGADTLVLIDRGRAHVESSAVLRILGGLGGLWFIATLLRAVPAGIRNRVYRYVARRRVRWFGRTECLVPDPETLNRFVDGGMER